MDNETNARIDEYLELYDRVNPVVKNAEVVASIIEQIGKDTRCKLLMNGRLNGNDHSDGNGEVQATDKQIAFLKKLKVQVTEGLSKQEASRLIDEAQADAT